MSMKKNKPGNNKLTGKPKAQIALLTFLVDEKCQDLALAYLKAYFLSFSKLSKSVKISIFSLLMKDNIDIALDKLQKLNPVIIGFSCYVWNIDKILALCRRLRQVLPQAKILLGGPEVSAQAKEFLEQEVCIDAIAVNEGEETFKELVEHWLIGSGEAKSIKGLVLRDEESVIGTPVRDLIEPLDRLPSPYLSLVRIPDKNNANLETMRGCSFTCGYCYYNKQYDGVRYFSLSRVKKELKFLLKNRVKTIYLMDPTFNLNRERGLEILRFFSKYKKDSKLHLEIKAELLDEEFVNSLAVAGIEFLEIGLQTTNRNALINIKRDFNERLFKNNIKLLNEKKINYSIQLIEGLPGDDFEGFKVSLDWVFALKPENIEIFRLMVLPGTCLRQKAEELKLKFALKPPYYILESLSFDEEELRKMEGLRVAALFLYRNLFSSQCIYLLCKLLKMDFSNLCQEWQEWSGKNARDVYNEYKENFADKPLIRGALYNIKLIELARKFSEFIFSKYSRTPLPCYILDSIHKYKVKFLEERGIIKERLSIYVN